MRGAAFETSAEGMVAVVEAEDTGVAATTVGQEKGGGKNKINNKQSSQARSEQKLTQNNWTQSYKDAATKTNSPRKKTLDK